MIREKICNHISHKTRNYLNSIEEEGDNGCIYCIHEYPAAIPTLGLILNQVQQKTNVLTSANKW